MSATAPVKNKRLCAHSQDKENNTIQAASTSAEANGRKTRRAPLSNIPLNSETNASAQSSIHKTSTIQPPPPPPPPAPTLNRSSVSTMTSLTNMSLDHVPRLSLTCLVSLCEMFMCSPKFTEWSRDKRCMHIDNILDYLLTLITSESFVEFVLDMLEKKLESLGSVGGEESAGSVFNNNNNHNKTCILKLS